MRTRQRHRSAPIAAVLLTVEWAAPLSVATAQEHTDSPPPHSDLPADTAQSGQAGRNAGPDAVPGRAGIALSGDPRREPDVLVINVAGDIAYPNGWGGIQYIDDKKHELFAQVQPILDSGDLNFANIECPLTEREPVSQKTYPIACKTKRLSYFTRAGFNLLSLANNHSIDVGKEGISDTLALLRQNSTEERPLYFAGIGNTLQEARRPAVFTPRGKKTRIAFFAVANTSYRSNVASVHDPELGSRIAAAAASTDLVMVSVHYGPEYHHVPPRSVVAKYRSLIDAGADLVVAHHPHVVQGVERYKKGVIFYSLGNFSFGSRTRRHLATGARMYSMIGRITVRKGILARVELIPLYANNRWTWTVGDKTLEPRHATPQLLSGPFAAFALDEFDDFVRRVPSDQSAESPGRSTGLIRVGDRAFVDLGHGPFDDAELAALHHEQAHEYAVVYAAGAEPRPATEAEKLVEGRGGTPDALVRQAQLEAREEKKRAQNKSAVKRAKKKKPRSKTPARKRRAARPGKRLNNPGKARKAARPSTAVKTRRKAKTPRKSGR
ncbi:MAG: CapA family protein [Proteobacteria bacterium]|nr:CapA family protein [Pseudomonadota bacterium]